MNPAAEPHSQAPTTRLGRIRHALWDRLRRWSGDDAYDRYCAEHANGAEHADCADHAEHGHDLLSRREFYRRYYNDQGKRPRCC